jgi:hypothetical protein
MRTGDGNCMEDTIQLIIDIVLVTPVFTFVPIHFPAPKLTLTCWLNLAFLLQKALYQGHPFFFPLA